MAKAGQGKSTGEKRIRDAFCARKCYTKFRVFNLYVQAQKSCVAFNSAFCKHGHSKPRAAVKSSLHGLWAWESGLATICLDFSQFAALALANFWEPHGRAIRICTEAVFSSCLFFPPLCEQSQQFAHQASI